MPDGVKNILSYGEQRRTIFLNAHNKDDYGRHRGHVLYGFNLSASGTVVSLAPGAIYTAQGQRLFVEVTDRTIDLGPGGLDVFNTSLYPEYPLCIHIFARYEYTTPGIAQEVDAAVAGSTALKLGARLVPYDRKTGAPAFNIIPVDPIWVSRANEYRQPETYPHVANHESPQVHTPMVIAGEAAANAVQFGEVPLGYVLIGIDPVTTTRPTSLDDPGVSIVTCKNAFEQIGEVIGTDILLPVLNTPVVGALVDAVGTALRQGYSARRVGPTGDAIIPESPRLMHPRYGTQELFNGSLAASPADRYREASFFNDGDSLLAALRRLDVVLRQVTNRLGAQSVVALTKDGSHSAIGAFASLDRLLLKLDGSLTAATDDAQSGNAHAMTWGSNTVLKDGLIPHVANADLVAKLATQEGDSHEAAITALDVAVYVLLSQVLGVSIPRAALRGGTFDANTLINKDERPVGRSASGAFLARPAGSTAYLTTETVVATLTELILRSQRGAGANLLRNGRLQATIYGATTETVLTAGTASTFMAPGWKVTDASWNVQPATWLQAADGFTVSLDAGTRLSQLVSGAQLGALLASVGRVAGVADITNAGAPLVLELTAYAAADGSGAALFTLTSAGLPTGAAQMLSVMDVVPAGLVAQSARLTLRAADNGAAGFVLHGAALYAGLPAGGAGLDAVLTDALSRDGGTAAAMRGPLVMGGQPVKDLPTVVGGLGSANLDGDAADRALRAADINATFDRRDGAKAWTGDHDAGSHALSNLAPIADPASAPMDASLKALSEKDANAIFDRRDGAKAWTGDHDAGGKKLAGLPAPASTASPALDTTHAAEALNAGTANAVFARLDMAKPFASDVFFGADAGNLHRGRFVADPVDDTDAANKQSVEMIVNLAVCSMLGAVAAASAPGASGDTTFTTAGSLTLPALPAGWTYDLEISMFAGGGGGSSSWIVGCCTNGINTSCVGIGSTNGGNAGASSVTVNGYGSATCNGGAGGQLNAAGSDGVSSSTLGGTTDHANNAGSGGAAWSTGLYSGQAGQAGGRGGSFAVSRTGIAPGTQVSWTVGAGGGGGGTGNPAWGCTHTGNAGTNGGNGAVHLKWTPKAPNC